MVVFLRCALARTLPAMSSLPTCARHPDVETRLACSSCETPICPACGREAAVGFKCPDCAAHDETTTSGRSPARGSAAAGGAGRRAGTGSDASGERTGAAVGMRTGAVGLAAALLGGSVLWPVLEGGMFFLLSSGVVGWGVARAVYWAAAESSSPAIRTAALALAGVAVAVAMGLAGPEGAASRGIALLAYPAALYGAWIVARQR